MIKGLASKAFKIEISLKQGSNLISTVQFITTLKKNKTKKFSSENAIKNTFTLIM